MYILELDHVRTWPGELEHDLGTLILDQYLYVMHIYNNYASSAYLAYVPNVADGSCHTN